MALLTREVAVFNLMDTSIQIMLVVETLKGLQKETSLW